MKGLLNVLLGAGIGLTVIGWIDVFKKKHERDVAIAKYKGYLKGLLAGNEEYAQWMKENYPEKYEEIESY